MSDSKIERIDVEYIVLDDKLLESRNQRLYFNDKQILLEGDAVASNNNGSSSVGIIREILFKGQFLF